MHLSSLNQIMKGLSPSQIQQTQQFNSNQTYSAATLQPIASLPGSRRAHPSRKHLQHNVASCIVAPGSGSAGWVVWSLTICPIAFSRRPHKQLGRQSRCCCCSTACCCCPAEHCRAGTSRTPCCPGEHSRCCPAGVTKAHGTRWARRGTSTLATHSTSRVWPHVVHPTRTLVAPSPIHGHAGPDLGDFVTGREVTDVYSVEAPSYKVCWSLCLSRRVCRRYCTHMVRSQADLLLQLMLTNMSVHAIGPTQSAPCSQHLPAIATPSLQAHQHASVSC